VSEVPAGMEGASDRFEWGVLVENNGQRPHVKGKPWLRRERLASPERLDVVAKV
jgi:hypothetical protein